MPASVLERDVLSARVRDYSPRLLDELLAAGEVMWVGAGPLGRDDGKVRLLLRGQADLLLDRLAAGGDRPDGKEHERLREVLAARARASSATSVATTTSVTLDALWDLVWAGEVTNDSFAPVRALSAKKRSGGKPRGGRPRLGALTALGPPTAQGRWSLVAAPIAADVDSTRAMHALAGVLLERHGVLTREAVRGEGVPGGFAAVYPVLRAMEEAGRIRRGYFVAGLGGAQFALPGAVDRLRAFRDLTPTGVPKVVVLAATDPANAYGLSLPWPVPASSDSGVAARSAPPAPTWCCSTGWRRSTSRSGGWWRCAPSTARGRRRRSAPSAACSPTGATPACRSSAARPSSSPTSGPPTSSPRRRAWSATPENDIA